jgi:hypothetical protein
MLSGPIFLFVLDLAYLVGTGLGQRILSVDNGYTPGEHVRELLEGADRSRGHNMASPSNNEAESSLSSVITFLISAELTFPRTTVCLRELAIIHN